MCLPVLELKFALVLNKLTEINLKSFGDAEKNQS